MLGILTIFVLFSHSLSQNPIIYDDDFTSIPLDTSLVYFEDDSNKLSINDFLTDSSFKFHPLGSYKNLGFSKSSFWVRFKVKNVKSDMDPSDLLLRLNDPEIYFADYFQLSEQGNIVAISSSGTMLPIGTRTSPVENLTFLTVIPTNNTHTIYLRINSDTPIMLDFSVMTMDQFLESSRMITLFVGLFIGIFFLAISYYSSLYFRFKDRSFLFLALAGIALLFDFLATSQFAYIYIWPDYTEWNKISVPLFDAIMLSFFIKFVYDFLNIKINLPGWKRIFEIVSFIFASFILLIFLVELYIIIQLINVFIVIALLLILISSFISFRKGYKPAKFFFIGIVLISISGIYNIVIEFGLLPVNVIGTYGYLVASIFLVWFFTQAVSVRIDMIKSEKESVQNELQKSENNLSALLNATTDVAFLVDEKYSLIAANKSLAKVSGKTIEELYGINMFELIPSKLAKQRKKYIDKAFQSGNPIRWEDDGVLGWSDNSVYPIKDSEGKVTRLAIFSLDMSERKKSESALRTSEKHFSLVIKGTNLGTWNWDISTGNIICNEQVFDMLGMKNNEIDVDIESWKDMIHPDDKEKVVTLLVSHVKGEISSYTAEYRIKHKSGRWIWVVARGKVVDFDNKGNALSAVGTILDITDRKRSEITQQVILNIANSVSSSKNMHEFYKTVHEQLNELFEAKNFQVALYDEKNNVILLPYSMDEYDKYEMIPAQKTCSGYVLKTKKAVLLKPEDIKRLVEEGEIEIYGTPSKIWLGVPLKVDSKIIGLIFIQSYEDENAYDEKDLELMEFVSDQIASSIARKQSEEQIRILSRSVEQSPASIVITDLEGNIEYVNPKFSEVTGYSFEDVKGKNPRILKSDETPKEFHKKLWKTISSGDEWKGEFLNKKKNGETFWELAYIAPIKNERGLTTHYLAVKEDISDRKKSREELIKARNYIHNILNSMPSVVIGVNEDCKVTHWNEEAEKITNINKNQATGKKLEDVFPRMSIEIDNIKKSIVSRSIIKDSKIKDITENHSQYSDLTVYPLISNGVEGAVIRIDDVTERVRMEEMMIQSEKMLSVGGLAAGMAHEINNPLAGMLQNAQVILNRLTKKMDKNDEVAKECNTSFEAIQTFMEKRKIVEMLEAINSTGKRASKIVENMLNFSRKSETRFSSHDIKKVLDDTIELAASDYDLKKKYDFRKIKIIKEYDEDIPLINCERSNIQQVFLNVLRNGAQAMMEVENKKEEPCFTFRVKQEKDMVKIEIEDNGLGMEEETRRRAFEPFYTTKDVSDGTGLGLSVSYFIITEQHKGKMAVESSGSGGTKILIELPRTE